jgi:cytochrome oxidase Cu insertion factor (SCO1/SenC/PrrC family)
LFLALLLVSSPTMADTSDAELWRAIGVSPAAKPVKAPSFTLRDLAGHAVSLDQFRGRVVMLYFWATW